jgi:two-component system response regulator FixJ
MNAVPPALVAVIDDDAAMREAVIAVLESVGIPAVGYISAQAFFDDPLATTYRCLILDVRMPGLSGIEAQRRLQDSGFHAPVIFISGHADVEMAVDTMKRGAIDFLPKPFRDQRLIDAVQVALQQAVAKPEDPRLADAKDRYNHLTPREREVLSYVSRGLRSKEIAADLGIAQKTVEEYRSRILEKMKVGSSCELTALATELQLIGQNA